MDIALFSYRPIQTPIHRVPATVKLAIMLTLDIAIFSCPLTILAPILGGITLFLAITALVARLRPAVALKNLRILLSFGIFIVLFKFAFVAHNPESIRSGLLDTGIYLWQLGTVLFTGSIFYETTSSLEIHHALSAIQNVIAYGFNLITRKKARVPDIALQLSLTIHFIPRIFSAWNALNDAWDARGGNRNKNFASYLRRINHLVPLLIAKLLTVAIDTDLAVKNRS
ncbi:MAG TPA: energy-coupling factor transporter transmembrane component T [Treponemataceae bacterium]|nr:energy-coupling factor transporter transmembrane component T [Treponemataceae bacterium]